MRVPASTSRDRSRPPATNRPISSIGRCVAESPMRCIGRLPASSAGARREIARCAPRFVACNCVHLVEDQRLDRAQHVARLRGEHQVERLGRRDQDVGRLLEDLAPLLLRRVAGAHRDPHLRLEPGERAAQVALDVVVERLQRRDVEHAQPLARRRVQAVERVEERGQRLAGAGRRLDQHVRAGRDRRPAERPAAASARRRCARTRPASPGRRLRAGPPRQVTPRLLAQVVGGEGDRHDHHERSRRRRS